LVATTPLRRGQRSPINVRKMVYRAGSKEKSCTRLTARGWEGRLIIEPELF